MTFWRRSRLWILLAVMVPWVCPAPIIYRPGEGWTYEEVGTESKWVRNRAKDQVAVAKEAFEKKEYRTALKAARRVVKIWPLSDYSGEAQYLVGRCYEARGYEERAFKEYQKVIVRHPKAANYDELLQRQYDISTRFLGGQWFKLWGYVPFFPSMERTAKLYGDVVKNGPYHETGPKSQMAIGTAREKQKNYPLAVKAYERAADRYQDRPEVASTAIFKTGQAYSMESKKAEYDQSVSGMAINSFNDFKALYPDDPRVPDAEQKVSGLRTEQARGAFETARFYEKYRRWQGALVYYNEALSLDPNAPFAAKARARIEVLRPKAEKLAQAAAAKEAAVRVRASGTNAVPVVPPTK